MTDLLIKQIFPNPNQPRQTFDETSLRELATSIDENELIQPITVEDNLDGTYTLVGGERRWRAFQMLGRETIPANIRPKSNHGGRELLIHAVIENVQREDMNPMDEAEAYYKLHTEWNMPQTEIALKTGQSLALISQRILLMKLDPEIRALVRQGLLHDGNFIRELLRIPNKDARIKLARRVLEDQMSIKQAAAMAVQVARSLGATRIERTHTPALYLAQRGSQRFSETEAPSGWNALKQAGIVPPWALLVTNVKAVCESCPMAPMANEAICGECALVAFLRRTAEACHA